MLCVFMLKKIKIVYQSAKRLTKFKQNFVYENVKSNSPTTLNTIYITLSKVYLIKFVNKIISVVSLYLTLSQLSEERREVSVLRGVFDPNIF